MNLLIKKYQQQKAFTLIELMLYVALLAIFISGAISFAWNVIGISEKNKNTRQLTDNMRFVSKKIQYYLRNADDINQVELQKVCLAFNDQEVMNPVAIYLEDETAFLSWGGPSDCSSPSGFEALNDPNIYVETMTFENLSSDDSLSKNINFNLKLSTRGDREEWVDSQTVSSSVELRSN